MEAQQRKTENESAAEPHALPSGTSCDDEQPSKGKKRDAIGPRRIRLGQQRGVILGVGVVTTGEIKAEPAKKLAQRGKLFRRTGQCECERFVSLHIGRDEFGRDVLSRLIVSIRISLLIALFGGAFGILVLSNLSSQRAANQVFTFVMLPQFFLGGVFNPLTGLPGYLDVLSRIAPLRTWTGFTALASPNATWTRVEGKGTVHSYNEVHHAIQPAFKGHTPYMLLLVDLDTQKGKPTDVEAIRVAANLTTPDGVLAPPDMVKRVGIGTRVRMVFADAGPGLAIPHWTIDEGAQQPATPWRYPQE